MTSPLYCPANTDSPIWSTVMNDNTCEIPAFSTAVALYPQGFVPPTPTIFQSYYYWILNSPLASFGSYVSHLLGRLYTAEMQGIIYQAAPLAVGAYVGTTALSRLKIAVLGYDHADKKRDFRQKAYDDTSLDFSQRADYFARGVFGTMSSKARATILADAIARLVVAGFLIAPFFAKDQQMTIDFEQIASYDTYTASQKMTATMQGTHQGYALHSYEKLFHGSQDQFGRQLGGLQEVWKKTLFASKIPQESQHFVNEIFNAPIEQLSPLESVKQNVHQFCNWTLGVVSLSNWCESVSFMRESYPIFYGPNPTSTFINGSALNEHYQTTLDYIQNNPDVLSKSASLQTHVEGFCQHIANTQSYLQPAYQRVASFLSDWGYPLTNTLSLDLSKKCADFAHNNYYFDQPDEERAKLISMVGKVYESLKYRITINDILTYQPMTGELSQGSIEEHIQRLYSMSQTIDSMDTAALEQAFRSAPESASRFVKSFFNIANSESISPKIVQKAYRQLAKSIHPDKYHCPEHQDANQCTNILNQIIASLDKLKQLITDIEYSDDSKTFYTFTEKFSQIYQHMTTPDAPPA